MYVTYTRFMATLKHRLRLNADVADKALQKKFKTILQILAAKPKLWKNLYFYKQYILNVTINFLFAEKWEKGQFYEKFIKKIRQTFCKIVIFVMADLYVCKSKKVKNMQDSSHKFFGA